MTLEAAPVTRTLEAIQAELEASLAVGHQATCSGCGMTVVRIAPPARSLVEDALRFGQPDYAHPGSYACPGPDKAWAKLIERARLERGRP